MTTHTSGDGGATARQAARPQLQQRQPQQQQQRRVIAACRLQSCDVRCGRFEAAFGLQQERQRHIRRLPAEVLVQLMRRCRLTPQQLNCEATRPVSALRSSGDVYRGGDEGEGEGKATHAHLGEENQFYYNKELKRWLIRGEEHLVQQQDTPPPPPAAVAATGGQPLDKAAAPAGGIRRMRARGAASLYTATPGLATKSSASKETTKRPLTFVMPPYRLPQQPHASQQQQTEGSEQGPPPADSSSHETAAGEFASEDTAAKGSEDKEGCRVRAAASEPPLYEGPGWTTAEEEQQQHEGPQQQLERQQQTAAVRDLPTENIEPLKRPPVLATASAQCSTGAPSPPEGEANPLVSTVEQQQQLEQAQGSPINGVDATVGEQKAHSDVTFPLVHNPQHRDLVHQQALEQQQEQEDHQQETEEDSYRLTAPMHPQDQNSALAEGVPGEPPRQQQQLVLKGGASATPSPEPYMQPADVVATAVAPYTAEAVAEYQRKETGGSSIEDAPAFQQKVAVPLHQQGSEERSSTAGQGVVSPWGEQQQEQQVEPQHQQQQAQQEQQQQQQCVEQPLQHEALALPDPSGSSSSSCSTGASPKSDGNARSEADGRATLHSTNSPPSSPQSATAAAEAAAVDAATPLAVAAPVPADTRLRSAGSLQTGEAPEKPSSHHPPSEVWGSSVSPAASLQQGEEHLLLEEQQEQQHQLSEHDDPQRREEQLQILGQQQYQGQQQLLQQGLFMEDILPGFARAVQDLEKSSAETLRQLAALQQQVGVLRSRNACLTASIQQVTEQILTGEGPVVERQRAAELLQDALGAAAAEFPSPMGDDSEPQPSPTCSAVSDAEAALEEAQGAVSALTQMLVEQMERNRQLQEEDMHFDADVVQFITQLQQQHGSLEPFLQQQMMLQEAHIEQQESLTNLKRMHDDLSRRMEESCARAADLEGQLALAYEKRQQAQQQLDSTQQELQRNQELLKQAQQENELRVNELLHQSAVWQDQLAASQQQLESLQQETERQKALLEELQERLAAATEREAAAVAARAAAEAAQEEAKSQVARAVHAHEQLQCELQHQQQEQQKQVEAALQEKQDALDRISTMQQLQHEKALEHRQQQEDLERKLLGREFMVERLQLEVNQQLKRQQQLQEEYKTELERLKQLHSMEFQALAEEHAGVLKQQEEQNQKLMEEKQRITSACQDEVERAQQKVDALQQQLAQQEEQHELMTQRLQEDSEQFLRRLQQQELTANEQLQQLRQQAEKERSLLEQSGLQREELTREVHTLRQRLEEVEAAAEARVESLNQQLRDVKSSLEAERNALQQKLQEATSDAQQRMEQHEALRKKHENLEQGYNETQQQAAREKSELEERVLVLEAQLQTQQGLLQAAREELLQQPILLQQKHEEDLQQQLAAVQQLELEERERLQQERDQILQQQQEKHALLMQQLREQHALEQQQLQQRMQQEQQEQQEALRSHFEQLWNEESAKMVAANAAVVEQLQQAQQLLLEEQQQLEAYEAQREALAKDREEAALLKRQLAAANANVEKLEQRCEDLERQREDVLQQRSTPEAEVQAAMVEELYQLRQEVVEKEQLARQLQQQLDEHVASQRDRLGEVNAMLERQEEASKQKDLRLRSVEEELQALQQLLQDTVDVKQLEAARAEVAEGNRRVQRLEADLATATAERESLKKALQIAEEKLKTIPLNAETGAGTDALSRHFETKEAGTQAVGDEISEDTPRSLANLQRQAQRAQQKNEELEVRNATLTRISDFLSRRLQFFERALADMGPNGLVVIEDCDRSVVLAPPEIESSSTEPSAPELVLLGGDGHPASSSRGKNAGASTLPVNAEEEMESGVEAPTAKENLSPPRISQRCSGDELVITMGGAPPTPPEFLRALKATPKT
ncbi:plectin, putative [Eimeria praecox]|uniref:Plectin, putative n=1 Tax=Eimeria praecox TaxID=51316 RepID=U6H2L8_9EIME|nr:plectin, putative [Eimeria praecox]